LDSNAKTERETACSALMMPMSTQYFR